MTSPFKKRRLSPEAIFIVSALIILAIFITVIVLALRFLLQELNTALGADALEPPSVIRFDIKGIEELQLK